MRIFWIIVGVVLVIGGVEYYNHHNESHAITSGDVFIEDRSKSGVAEDAAPTKSTAQDPTAATAPAAASSATTPAQTDVLAAPAGDTINRNPPNGMIFAGSGRYQIYRQGDVTWRIDTDNGRACVLFATDDEWRKERVYRLGCGDS